MGLFRAVIILLISMSIANMIFNNKHIFVKYPFVKKILLYFDNSKCYFIISLMTFLMILW